MLDRIPVSVQCSDSPHVRQKLTTRLRNGPTALSHGPVPVPTPKSTSGFVCFDMNDPKREGRNWLGLIC